MAKKRSPSITGTTMTTMQELASAWIFKRAIQDNQRFLRAEDIRTGNPKDKGKTYNELLKIWKETSKGKIKTTEMAELHLEENGWLDNFYKQSGRLLREVGNTKFTVFTRGKTSGYTSDWYDQGETFMDWIAKYVAKEFKIQRKDNWNPADVWLIKDEKKWKNVIIRATKTKSKAKGSSKAQLMQLNQIMRILFRNKHVMGISLKKISGMEAKWKEVNVTNKFFKNIESIEMKFESGKCKFGPGVVTESQEERGRRKLLLPTKAGSFALETQETMITLDDPANNGGFEIQIKANDNSKFDNLKYEPKDLKNKSARLGKATTAFVDDLMKAYGQGRFIWKRSWKDYPQNLTEFTEREQNKYQGMIQELKSAGIDIGNVTPLEAVINIKETFRRTSQPQTANSKLMQLTWLYNVMSLPTKERNGLLTDMIYLAEKAGRGYGPYGKLY